VPASLPRVPPTPQTAREMPPTASSPLRRRSALRYRSFPPSNAGTAPAVP